MKLAQKARKAKAPVAKTPRPRRKSEKDAPPGDQRQEEKGFLFLDPYWDDQFCSYYDPTLRTCCNR
jgi:hypothetical protein